MLPAAHPCSPETAARFPFLKRGVVPFWKWGWEGGSVGGGSGCEVFILLASNTSPSAGPSRTEVGPQRGE